MCGFDEWQVPFIDSFSSLDFFLPMKWKNLAPGANSRLFPHAQAHKFLLLHNNQMGRSRFSSLPWNNVFFLLKRNSKVTLRRQHKRWRRKFFFWENFCCLRWEILLETFHVSLSVKCCCLKVNVFVSNWVLLQFFRHLCEQQVFNHWQEAILHELVVKGERTKTNVALRSETTATIRVDTRVRETNQLEFYDNSGAVDLR